MRRVLLAIGDVRSGVHFGGTRKGVFKACNGWPAKKIAPRSKPKKNADREQEEGRRAMVCIRGILRTIEQRGMGVSGVDQGAPAAVWEKAVGN